MNSTSSLICFFYPTWWDESRVMRDGADRCERLANAGFQIGWAWANTSNSEYNRERVVRVCGHWEDEGAAIKNQEF
jgi:hypothetical protein